MARLIHNKQPAGDGGRCGKIDSRRPFVETLGQRPRTIRKMLPLLMSAM